MNRIVQFLLQPLIVLLVRYEKTWKPFWLCIKDLFATHPKRAHVLKCHICGSVFWGKTKIRYPEKMCPNCETKSSLFVPSDISIKEREKMWRFLDDQDKESRDELDRYERMEEKSEEMYYDGHWGNDNPGFLNEISEKIRENLR